MNKYYTNLFQPIKIGKLIFRNRIFSAPNMMSNITPAGCPTDYMIGYYEAKAKGGCAQVTVGDTPVDEEYAPAIPRHLILAKPNLPWLSELAKAIRQHGAIASIELNHGGLTASPEITGNNPIGPVGFVRADGVPVTAMDEAMMERVADNYARSAALIKTAGFDMCMLHGAHGWLLDQFLSPYFNNRTDDFGGSLQNRARFPILVIERVREAVGKDFPIEYRIGPELIEGGLTVEEVTNFVKMVENKIDLVHVSAGLDTIGRFAVITHPTAFLPQGCNVKYAEAVKQAVNIPVVTVGAITTPELAEQILAEGKADIVAMARAIIADPEFANKARTGCASEIRPCLRCLDCLTVMQSTQHFACSVNPHAGREFRMDVTIKPPRTSKNVLVIGGGPAGMTAAITAAARGHNVTLAEKTESLGGLLKFTEYDALKVDLKSYKDYLIGMTYKSGTNILYNTDAGVPFIKSFNPDALIIASGSRPVIPAIPGIGSPGVKHAIDVYTALEKVGDKVAIIGGGLVGCETGLFLAELGKDVTIIEIQDSIISDANWMHKEGLLQSIAKKSVSFYTGTTCTEVTSKMVKTLDKSGISRIFDIDTVIYAVGMQPRSDLVDELQELDIEYFASVGDCVKIQNISGATFSAYHAAIDIS